MLPDTVRCAVTARGAVTVKAVGGVPEVLPQVISGYCEPAAPVAPLSSTVTAGVVVKAAEPITRKGATLALGCSLLKLKSSVQPVPALLTVRLGHVHCFVLSVMETPSAAELPDVAASETAELEQLPPVTPTSAPALTAVLPL